MRLDQGFLATKTFQFSMQPATLNMPPEPCETLCIVGAGLMGAQIGLQSAVHGHTVWLVDNLTAQLQRAKDTHTQELAERFDNQQITA
jgi:3-hydroxyacyl-CoA dehydrogenase